MPLLPREGWHITACHHLGPSALELNTAPFLFDRRSKSKRRRRQNRQVLTSCGPQIIPTQKIKKNSKRGLYSTCASPVVPHPSTGHAHGCLASEIGRDPAFPTRFDRTVSSPEVSLLTPSRHTIGRWKGTGCKNRIEREKREFSKELRGNRE